MNNTVSICLENNVFAISVTDELMIKKALEFIERLYKNRTRDNGETFMVHPLSTVQILQNDFHQKLSDRYIIVALLHDALWIDHDRTKKAIESQFGEDILTDITRLTKRHIVEQRKKLPDDEKTFFELLVSSGDQKLILIKYAERLHNMTELCQTTVEKQTRFLAVTKTIYLDYLDKTDIIPDIVKNIFREKYHEITTKLNLHL